MLDSAVREERVVANGLAHRVLRWGPADGETFVLCHGYLDFAWSWARTAELLALRGHQVIAFDWRGHGETARVGVGGYYHFPDYVLDLSELLAKLTERPPHLVGHSMGGTVCALFAGAEPAAIRSLALIEGLGPPAHGPAAGPDRVRAWLRGMETLRGARPPSMPSLADAAARLRKQHPDLDEPFSEWLARKGTRPSEDGGVVWAFDPMHRTTSPSAFNVEVFRAFLARIEAPTLVVSGSRGFRPADHDERVGSIPARREVVLDDVGHMIHWFAADRLATELEAHARPAMLRPP